MTRSSYTPAAQVVLNGRYELGQPIAEGGMAQVYRGRDQVLDRDVAIKVLRAQYAASPEFLDRFHREARLAASLAHPNLVNVFDVGDDGDRHYIVMELLPGRTLKDLLARGPLPLEQAVELALQVAKGMAYAHRRGLVHRDLKPQNVLLTEDDHAKVADFGLAQGAETAQLTTPGTVWGTVQYLSPEQAQGMRPDARSDVYALGAMWYELLTGHPPYEGGTPASIMMRQVYDPPPSLREAGARFPVAAEHVLQRALAKTPDDRYQSMDELAQALTDLREAAGAETMVWSTVPGASGAGYRPPAGADGRATLAGRASSPRSDALPTAVAETVAAPAGRPAARPGRAAETALGIPPLPMAARRRARPWVPLALAAAVLAFFALMAMGALLASRVVRPLGNTTQPTALPRATATVVATLTPMPPTATPIPLVPVPNLLGQTLARAQERLTEAGLRAETAEDFSREFPAGQVAAQDPPANAQLKQGDPVKVTVSKGPQRATVPNVIGEQVETAAKKLIDAGFAVKRSDEFTPQGQIPFVPVGFVFDQTPRSGEANTGSDVMIRVSKGRDEVVVPQVLGLQEQAAVDLVTRAGLRPEVRYEANSGVDPGLVFTQDPIPNARIDRGSVVVLRVRRDPTPVPATAAPTRPAATPTPGPAASATRPAATATAGR